MTAHHGHPVPVTSKGPSSQAGVQSFKHSFITDAGDEVPAHLCPECQSELRYSRRLHESICPDCTYARTE